MASCWSLQVAEAQSPAPLAAGTELPISGEIVVGRSREADLVIRDDRVSRRHALLVVREDGLWVEPLGTGSVYLGREPVIGATRLCHDDWLQLGPLLFRVQRKGSPTLLSVDLESERAWLGGRLLALRPAEFNLVRVLAQHCGVWLAPEDLAQAIWIDDPRQANLGYVDKYVSYLRRAIRGALADPALLEAVRLGVQSAAEGGEAPSEPAALARELVKSRKKVGYRLQLPADRVRVFRELEGSWKDAENSGP